MTDNEKDNPNSKKAFDYLVSKGVKEHIAAGIVGNLMQESYGLERTWAPGKVDSKGSMGVMQWHGKRLNNLYDYQKEKDPNYTNGKPISLYDQLDFILHEAETGAGDPWMKKQYDKAFAATNSRDAALAFSKNVLRPHVKYAHNDKRMAYADKFKVLTEEGSPMEDNYKKNPSYKETTAVAIDNTDTTQDYRARNDMFKSMFNESTFEVDPEENIAIPTQEIQPQVAPEEITKESEVAPQKESYSDFIENYLKTMNTKGTKENAEGGKFNSFNEGGTHEQNPHGGIPLGFDQEGTMNTVEEGETSYDFKDGKYIFSDRIKL